jgi:hypothetical protein
MRCEAGVYRREVVDAWGVVLWILIPRFLCRGLGPRRPKARTFSVLSAEVLPRRKWSLGWMLKVALWCSDSLVEALDRLSDAGLVVEARQVRRALEVLGVVCERFHQHPVEGMHVEPGGPRRRQALELCLGCQRWEASGRGPPGSLVMAWNLRWDSLLMDIRVR